MGGASMPFGSNELPNVEQWSLVFSFRGHSADVQDLAWSPDSRCVASCSVDNKIIVWDVTHLAAVRTLHGHTNWIKGLTWDPVGKYLASQSDDKSVIIWRVSDWQIEARIEEPYQHGTATGSFFRRLSWSPDGHYITTTHAYKPPKQISAVIGRHSWKVECDFVGPKLPIVVTRFNPCLFGKQDQRNTTAPLRQYSCCAVGSQDGSVSVWVTTLSRPIIVLSDLFSKSVVDMSWGSDGYSLMIGSTDGSVAFVQFESTELGALLPEEDKERIFKETYGLSSTSIQLSKHRFAENPSLLQLQKRAELNQAAESIQGPVDSAHLSALAVRMTGTDSTTLFTSSTVTAAISTDTTRKEQREIRQSDGRRRITPVLVRPALIPAPTPTPVTPPAVTEPVAINEPVVYKPPPPPPALSFSPSDRTTTVSALSDEIRQKEKPPNDVMPDAPVTVASPTVRKKLSLKKRSNKEKKNTVPAVSAVSSESEAEDKHRTPKRRKTDKPLHDDTNNGPPLRQPDGETSSRPLPSASPVIATPAPLTAPLTVALNPLDKGPNARHLEISVHREENRSSIRCVAAGVTLWSEVMIGCCTLATANMKFSAVACSDNSLHVFSCSGRRLFPPMIMSAPICFLDSALKSSHLMIVSSDAKLTVWDLKSCKRIISESMSGLLSADVTVDRARLGSGGRVIVSLSSNDSFVYDSDMCCWMRVAQGGLVNQHICSEFVSRRGDGVLAALQSRTMPVSRTVTTVLHNSDGRTRDADTRAHLANQVVSALALQSLSEYRYWIRLYVRRLTADSDAERLRELCEEFIGPLLKTGPTSQWQPLLMGVPKRDFLRDEILPLLAENHALQRLISEMEANLQRVDSFKPTLSESSPAGNGHIQ
eukprot:GILJ01015253.1.p1 GENE.GILJ01015253.1~~GILJ01015253.1.p1  ORF type:complete len:964 (-),score=158.74 GILJ01015253.1:236-2866(-)